jgi:hypothetical protein
MANTPIHSWFTDQTRPGLPIAAYAMQAGDDDPPLLDLSDPGLTLTVQLVRDDVIVATQDDADDYTLYDDSGEFNITVDRWAEATGEAVAGDLAAAGRSAAYYEVRPYIVDGEDREVPSSHDPIVIQFKLAATAPVSSS